VKDRVNDKRIGRRLIEYLVRKATHERTAKLIYGDRKEMWMPLDGEDTRLDAPNKVLAESGPTALMPVVGRCNIIASLLGENDALNHAAHVPAA